MREEGIVEMDGGDGWTILNCTPKSGLKWLKNKANDKNELILSIQHA